MSINLADLKAQQAKLLEKIKNKASNTGNSFEDSRIWNVTFDKEKGGGATIRFLPSPDGATEMPYEKVIRHFFQGPNGKYYTEASLRTLDEKDPVADLNYRLYNTKIKSNQDQASRQKQKPRYYTNILVINDNANPENNGKVFLYEYGPAVQNMIEEKMFPNEVTDPGVEPINPFNIFEAPNLILKLTPQKLGKAIVPSYDKSHFDYKMTDITETHDNIEEILQSCHSLKEFTDPENFKSFKELSDKLIEVLGEETGTGLETVMGYKQLADTAEVASAAAVAEEPKETVAKPKTKKEPKSENTDELDALRAMIGE